MHRFIVIMLIAAITFPFFVEIGVAPRLFRFIPELMGVVAAALVVVLGVRDRFRNIRAGYWLIFGAIAFIFVASAIANSVESGPIFASLRNYLRALPFFFLAAVVALEPHHVRSQLRMMMFLAILQLPIALYQRTTSFERGALTGDLTVGTLLASGPLSIFLISIACILTAFYLRKRIAFLPYLVALVIVLIPTALNETKVSIFLIPVGLLTTFILAERGTKRMVACMKALFLLAAFSAVFIPIYDYYVVPRQGYGIVDFFTDPDTVENYFSKGQGADIGDTQFTRRGDAITIPLRVLSDDPVHLALGLGPGNVSDSALGERYTGEYFATLGPFLQTLWTIVSLELGLLGFVLLLALMWMVFTDARIVARQESNLMGAMALGWTGVIGVVVISYFYAPLMPNAALTYPFWYFAGLVAAHRMRLSATDSIDTARATTTAARGRRPVSPALARNAIPHR